LIFGSDELLITDLLFSGKLRKLTSLQIDKLFTLFVNEERLKKDQSIEIPDEKLQELFS